MRNPFAKNKSEASIYDPARQILIIRASICNGEQVAGFKDIETGKFEEIMAIRDAQDLELFKRKYGIEGEIKKYIKKRTEEDDVRNLHNFFTLSARSND